MKKQILFVALLIIVLVSVNSTYALTNKDMPRVDMPENLTIKTLPDHIFIKIENNGIGLNKGRAVFYAKNPFPVSIPITSEYTIIGGDVIKGSEHYYTLP